eukprot:CAMPEP_0119384814 /NCGR_PEP_ID=MMETSP1334-20130426/87772_1 /TAXON_ID=127549 /ORGANISM="Calcidiscus leptoporus, Strain RCC1130" /LENGTH=75 /DNA_ID=CAMNT_0007405939 /DNA_START=60 /DNA_END=284 /DNA_ORIENTATION=+
MQPLASAPVEIRHPAAADDAASSAGSPPLVVRCSKCSAYLNPLVRLHPRSNKWECNLCGSLNELPPPAAAAQPMQ